MRTGPRGPDLVLAFPDPSGPIGPIGPMAALTKAGTTNMSVYSSARMYCSPGYSTGLDPDRPDPRQGAGPMSRTHPAVTTGTHSSHPRQAGYVSAIRWRHRRHRLSSQWTIYIAFYSCLTTQNLDHGTAMEIRQYTLAVLAGNVRSSSQAQLRG